ncbi:hypothetical protein [Gilvibacter sediminis]|uniref:hypothetical protein n=1 Tax=Gilvibacter sediminis TaxID=379071 RepID=UPI002350455A|nr:hypothetical protein [Gilvibacter sediminis]MDC7996851.1 hypothetical protein [Gilvibacter sediminis]
MREGYFKHMAFVVTSVIVVAIGLKTLGVYFAFSIPLFMVIFIIIAKKSKK